MHAAFTVELPANVSGQYPSTAEVVEFLRSFGWELAVYQNLDGAQIARVDQHRKLASKLLKEMPEAAPSELEYIIFFGYQHDNQIPFIVSRMVPSQITFRLISNDLAILQTSMERIVKKVISSRIKQQHLDVSNDIMIYEPTLASQQKSSSYISEPYRAKVMIIGRIIPSVFVETRRRARKDFVVAGFSIIMLIFLAQMIFFNINISWVNAVMEELFIVAFTLLGASVISIIQSYLETYIDVRQNHLVIWSNTSGTRIVS